MKYRLHFIQKLTILLCALFMANKGYSQNALNFDGVDDYVISPYNGITGNSSRTIEAWINPVLKSTQAVIVDMGLSSTGQRFTLNLINGKLRIEVGGSGLIGTTVIPDGKWHHVAVTYDNSVSTGKFNLYIDGVQEGSPFDLPTAVNTGSGDLRIGGRVDDVNFFQGAIDEVRVWNKAKSLAQIVADTGAEFCTSQFGLVAYHRFNQATAGGTNTNDTISLDDSGLGLNGRLYGFTLSGSTSNWVNGKLSACIPPTCLNPNALGATNIFGTTADIYWTQSNSGSTFKMEYGPAGFTLGTGTKSTPTNDTVSLTGLSATTAYDVYVKEICSATDSSTWAMLSFSTGCGLINTFPYMEPFDSSSWVSGTGYSNTGFVIDPCWTSNPSTGSYIYLWGTKSGSTSTGGTGPTTDYSGNGNYLFTESSYGSTGNLATVTSPTIDLSSLTVPQLSFQYHMYGSSTGTLMVWAWNGSSYDTVWTLSGDQGNAWVEGTVDLSSYSSTYTHLTFAALKGSSSYGDIAIDHVTIDEAPACPKPSLFQIDSITSSSVRLNFVSSGTEFQIEFGPVGFTQGTGTTNTITSSGHTVTGLSSNTEYDFYILNDCTDSSKGTSAWVGPLTARTLCSYTNSYFNNWDQLANNDTDPCWTFLSYGFSGAYAKAYAPYSTSTPQAYSGNIYYRFYNGYSSINYLISPEITDLDQNTLQLRFQATDTYSGTAIPEFYIGTMSNTSDTSTYVAIDTIETISNVWTEFTVLLNNVTSGHKHVVIRHSNNAGYIYMGIDDLYIEAIPSCLPPTAGAFSSVKDTSLVLSWLPGDGATYEVEYGNTGFTQGSGITISGIADTSIAINGLTAETCYEFYVRGICGSSNSPWAGPYSICTECAVEVAPYLEDFDDNTWVDANYTGNQINSCWTRTPDPAFTYRWETDSSTTTTLNTGPTTDASGTGKYVFTESTYGTYATLATLETPYIEFSSLTTPTLSFAYHMFGNSMGNLYVLISNGSQNDTVFTISGQQQQSSSEAWQRAYVNLSSYTGSPRKIQFIGERGASGTSDMAIDEVSVDEMPTCLTPNGFTLDTVGAVFADFSWGSVSNGNSFKMEYGPVGFTQGSSTLNTVYSSASPTTVSGLTPNTSYDIYLTDMCDSTSWIGPITFTTLIQDDAELQHLISPSNLSCGDSSMMVEVMVKNNGLNAITNLPVSANVTGAAVANISTVFSGPIAPGASATVQIGTINTYPGGTISIDAYTALTGDQDVTNDTLKTNAIEVISAQPMLHPIDTICANDSIGQFAAITQTGIIYNWYQNANDPSPFATGDTVDVLPNQTLFVDRSKEVNQLVVDAPYTSSQFGNMFKVYVKNDFTFTGFSFVPATSGTLEPIAFYKQGNFVGHETTRGDWTPIDSITIPGGITNNWYRINFANPVQFSAGDTISFYLANKQGTKMRWEQLTQLNAVGDQFFNNADFEYYAGVTGAYFGNNMTSGGPRAVSSIIHYASNDVCSNSRLAFTMGVRSDSAVADFSAIVNANGADVDFDASASEGHIYDWNFGDGNNGTGENTSHTYTTSGTYSVTLTVTDTVCGTTDTLTKTVLANVSLKELVVGKNISVYPNPSNGTFKVDLNLNGGHYVQLTLVNTVGQIVHTKDLGNIGGHAEAEVSIENLTPGIYYLNVLASGKTSTVKITVLN